MFLFGHVGITVFAAEKIKPDADLRKVAFMSLAADLIDKPIGLLYPEAFGNNTRIAAHTIWACIILAGLLYALRKRMPEWKMHLFAYSMHMVLDRSWMSRERRIFLWPFFGEPLEFHQHALERWSIAFIQPYTVVSESIGALILIHYFIRYKFWMGDRLRQFLRSGRLTDIG